MSRLESFVSITCMEGVVVIEVEEILPVDESTWSAFAAAQVVRIGIVWIG